MQHFISTVVLRNVYGQHIDVNISSKDRSVYGSGQCEKALYRVFVTASWYGPLIGPFEISSNEKNTTLSFDPGVT